MNKVILFFFLLGSTVQASVLSYNVEVRPSFKDKSISGRVNVKVSSGNDEISFPLYDLMIDSVVESGKSVPYKVENQRLHIFLETRIGNGSKRTFEIAYHGQPKHGLIFGSNYVYSAFSTCEWMICDDDPGQKAIVSFDIIVPETFKTVASGDYVGKSKSSDGLVVHHWTEDRPYSSYIFGFAAGDFHEARSKIENIELRYLGVLDDEKQLSRKFQDTEGMLRFFELKAGVLLPHKTYTQVLVPGSEAQENSSFSVLGNDVIDPILTNPQEDWAIAHELAHQWWGNLLTCKSWDHFWLNEGITVFMVAAYKEKRWGKEAYQREMDLSRKRYQRAIDAQFDVPLTYAGAYPSLQIKRAIVYSKGALFMNALRKELGEKAFWLGLKTYTQNNVGQSVVSDDFQKTMEGASGKKLDQIFKKWVY